MAGKGRILRKWKNGRMEIITSEVHYTELFLCSVLVDLFAETMGGWYGQKYLELTINRLLNNDLNVSFIREAVKIT